MSEMEKSEAPTLFQVNGPVGLANWKDYCLDLSDSQLYGELTSDSFALKDRRRHPRHRLRHRDVRIIYNKELLTAAGYTQDDITSFDTLKAVADDIQAARTSWAFRALSPPPAWILPDWRYKTHLANLPIYYEYKADGITSTDAIKGTYLDNYKQIFDLYITDSTCEPTVLAQQDRQRRRRRVRQQAGRLLPERHLGLHRHQGPGRRQPGHDPHLHRVDGEENQGLCTGSENYWCVNNMSSEEDIQATWTSFTGASPARKGTAAMPTTWAS